jgi:hypothetical protein
MCLLVFVTNSLSGKFFFKKNHTASILQCSPLSWPPSTAQKRRRVLKLFEMRLKSTFAALLLVFVVQCAFAQTSGSFTVGGDFDKFYPVTFNDPAWYYNEPTVLKIGRSSVHENTSWRGALISSFSYHLSHYGHGAHFIDASIKNSMVNFIAGWHDASTGGTSGVVIIWLRGGGTTYYFNANYGITPTIYDGVANALPFQQHNGPAHSYKTAVDSYVNSNGASSSGVANFASGGNNYFEGNVGIGTAAPGSKLSIREGDRGVSVAPGMGGYYGSLAFNREATTGAIFNTSAKAFQINNGPDQNMHFQVWNGSGGLVQADAIVIAGNSGFVGIGTSNPKEHLSVNGKIRAHEIKVETTNWPDYVFAPEHKLPSLSDTEKFIKENRHLPEIPSAAEAEKEGISLGEMNAKLLKKIEELTLHLIEQNKMTEELLRRVDSQDALIKELKNQSK